jgi:DNA-binding IclR family transcriptional regulator
MPNPLERTLAVLEAVISQPQPVGRQDLVARLDLKRMTLHRILGRLVETGLLVRDTSRERYSVGPKLSSLAFDTLRSLNQTAPVRAILQDLVDDIGESCNVGVLDTLHYVNLQRVECVKPLRVHLEVGTRVAAHCVSGGKLMLAHLPDILRTRLLNSRPLAPATSRSITDVGRLEAEFSRIRFRGYALNNQEYMDGIVGAAVPIMDRSGNVLAAVGMQGPMPRLTVRMCRDHIPSMQRAAQRIANVWCA